MSQRYRIFHLIKSLGRGGAEVLLIEGLRYTDSTRFISAYGYFVPWKDALVPSLKSQGAEVVCFNGKDFVSMLLQVPLLAQHLLEWRADLIHCHLPLAGVAGRLAARIVGIPVVYTEHNVMERYNSWTRRMNLLTWKLQEAVVAVSGEVKQSIESSAGKSVSVSVIANGIPVDSFGQDPIERARVRKEWSIPADAFVVGTVAVFRPQKDLHNWLRAASLIRKRVSQVHFLLVGDGVMMKDVRSFANESGLNGSVHFTGLQEDSARYFSAMDVYLSSSVFEGLPLALLEAMATSLPVVVTAVGGVPEVVADAKTGYMAAPKQPEALAEKVCALYENEALRRKFGAAGRSVVEERFGMKRMMQELEELYSGIIQRDRLRRRI